MSIIDKETDSMKRITKRAKEERDRKQSELDLLYSMSEAQISLVSSIYDHRKHVAISLHEGTVAEAKGYLDVFSPSPAVFCRSSSVWFDTEKRHLMYERGSSVKVTEIEPTWWSLDAIYYDSRVRQTSCLKWFSIHGERILSISAEVTDLEYTVERRSPDALGKYSYLYIPDGTKVKMAANQDQPSRYYVYKERK